MIIVVVMGLIVTSVFIGCAGRYAFEKTEGGFYRVDKWTGETTWMVGGATYSRGTGICVLSDLLPDSRPNRRVI
jgi:hypothetical protein